MFSPNAWHGTRADQRALQHFLTRGDWKNAARRETRHHRWAQVGVQTLILCAAVIIVVMIFR